MKAARGIKAPPHPVIVDGTARLAAMQQRIEAMIAAVGTVQPPLEKFYGPLNDEQKARLTALGQDQRRKSAQKTDGSLAQSCGATLPVSRTGRRRRSTPSCIRPTRSASLTALQNASAKARIAQELLPGGRG